MPAVCPGGFRLLGHQRVSPWCPPPVGLDAMKEEIHSGLYLTEAPILRNLGPCSSNLHLLTVAMDTLKMRATSRSLTRLSKSKLVLAALSRSLSCELLFMFRRWGVNG